MVGARRIRSEKLREHQYMEGYARCLKSKRVEWDVGRNVEEMWEQVKKEQCLIVQDRCVAK